MKTFAKLLFSFSALFLLTACSSTEDRGPRASLGNADAPVLIEEFSDLQCPACGLISPMLEEIVRNNPTVARMEYYHFPLPQHQFAQKAAEAAECAGDQGKFWEYVKVAFKNQKSLTEDNLKSFATQLGLNSETFDDCLDSNTKKSAVKADLYEGRRRSVSSTPSIFVNGTLVRWSNKAQFEAYIKSLQ